MTDILDRRLAPNEWTTTQLIEQRVGLINAQLDQAFDIRLKTVRATHDQCIYSIAWWTDLMNAQPQRNFEHLGMDPMSLDGLAKRLELTQKQEEHD